MSLNFDLTAIKDRLSDEEWHKLTTSKETRDAEDGKKQWHPVTNAIIWAGLSLDLSSITEENVDEWTYRALLLQHATGAFLSTAEGPVFLTEEDFRSHIGLRTNCTTRSRKDWLLRIFTKQRGKVWSDPANLKQAPHTNSAHSIAEGGPRDGKPLSELLAEDEAGKSAPAAV